MPPGAIYVGRPSRWGNPFRPGETYMWLGWSELPYPIATWRDPGHYEPDLRVERLCDPETAVRWFSAWYSATQTNFGIAPLRGRDLVCWCPLDQPCHADVLLELANR